MKYAFAHYGKIIMLQESFHCVGKLLENEPQYAYYWGEEHSVIIGIGTDLVEIDRMARLYDRFGKRFLEHILAPGELAAPPSKITASWLGSRFAAKEAAVKALGTGFAQGIIPQQIEIAHKPSGQPELVLHGQARRRAAQLGASVWHVTLSHERQYALAFVILED